MADYAGDILWALAALLGFGLILPRASTWTVALLAMAFSLLIEVGQLYHAPWIDSIRRTTLGRRIAKSKSNSFTQRRGGLAENAEKTNTVRVFSAFSSLPFANSA